MVFYVKSSRTMMVPNTKEGGVENVRIGGVYVMAARIRHQGEK